MEVDPTVVLDLLDESSVDRDSTWSNMVPVDKEMPMSDVDYILRSELKEKRLGSVSKQPLCDADADVAEERRSKSVAFQFDDEEGRGRSYSAGCELVGVSDVGQAFPTSYRSDDIDYGTSELESIARRRVDDLSEGRVHEAEGMGLPCSFGSRVQHELGTGRSKHYPSDSARTLLKECFADNAPVQLDLYQQLTGMSSDQMIQFARAIGSEVSLATFGTLQDVML